MTRKPSCFLSIDMPSEAPNSHGARVTGSIRIVSTPFSGGVWLLKLDWSQLAVRCLVSVHSSLTITFSLSLLFACTFYYCALHPDQYAELLWSSTCEEMWTG
ncbi:hypothetical protein BDZ91DRAFT_729748 [Kalaharituber pfeilii]|nr:hypothetical protein BDZ91DRAFT_729748 [Kalaharituber pfeilii]